MSANDMSLADLEAEVAQRRAEEQARAERALYERELVRDAWLAQVMAKAAGIEEQLAAEEGLHFAQLESCVDEGDLNGAFAAYIDAQRTVRVRNKVRTAAQNAADRLNLEPHTAASLNMIRGEFVEWVQRAQCRAVDQGVDERVEELIGIDPNEVPHG